MQFVVIGIALICLASARGDDKYMSKFNNVDLEAIMKNDRLLLAYFKCLTEGVACTSEGQKLKKVLPEAIRTGCAKCTDEHKAQAKKMVTFLMKEKPQIWEKLITFYDPDNIFRQKFKEQLMIEGFKV